MVQGRYHIVVLLICAAFVMRAQPSRVPTQISGVINRYEFVAEIAPCDSTVRVSSATQFRVGDEVLMIQMQGARISEADDSTYGAILDMNGAGCAEFLTVGAVNGDRITFTSTWVHPYATSGVIQLVSVPRYADAIVNGTVTAPPFNGTVGGVVVLRTNGVLTLQGNIDVSGAGFRGGAPSFPRDICTPRKWVSNYFFGEGGEKGDGIAVVSTNEVLACRGPRGTGGGGGNGGNAGGAGGGNGGAGGYGGDANNRCSIFKRQGGYPGHAVDSLLLKQRIFLGGGGGGGHQNNIQGTRGGGGGGIVIVKAGTIAAVGGSIISDGETVRDTVAWDGGFLQPGDGAGGGGAGGSVLLDVGTIAGTLDVRARGGNGGIVGARYQPNGPGGGGGGGAIILATSVRPNLRTDVSGGVPGYHISPETADSVRGSSWGATAGAAGAVIEGFMWRTPSRITLNAFGGGDVCPGDSVNLEATEGFMLYRWSNGDTRRVIRVAAAAGTYSVTAIDSAGCSQTAGGLVVIPDPTRVTVQTLVNFGSVDYQRTYIRTVSIRSLDDDTIVVSRIVDAQNFTVVDPTIFPLVLPPFGTVDVEIRFVSPEPREYNERMTVEITEPCPVQTTFDLYAKVNPLRIVFSIPDTVGAVGRTIALPIRTNLQPDTLDLPDARLQFSVRMNASILAPLGVSRGRIIGDMIDVLRRERVLTIELDSVMIPRGTSELTSILAMVLLSTTRETVLDLVDVSWLRVYQTPITTIDDGSLATGPVCYTEGRAVRVLYPTNMRVGPSPASDIVTVSCALDAPGTYAIEITDVRGRTVYSHREDVSTYAGGRPLQVQIPVDGWEQGAYVVRLIAPITTESAPLIIVR